MKKVYWANDDWTTFRNQKWNPKNKSGPYQCISAVARIMEKVRNQK